MLLVLFTVLLFTVWEILYCAFQITFLSYMYDKIQTWSIRRELRIAQKGSRSIVLLSRVLILERPTKSTYFQPACGVRMQTHERLVSAAMHPARVLGARRTSTCSCRSDKQLEGVTLHFHHGQTHQLLSLPLKLLAHPTDNCPCSLVGEIFFFLTSLTHLR